MSKRKTNNVFQCRLYDLHDNLVSKEMVCDLKAGQNKIIRAFEDEHYGPLYTHGAVRCLDLWTKRWIIPAGGGMNNSNAAFFDPEILSADGWRITLYDMGDNNIFTALSKQPITEQMYSFLMINKGALYCVVSAREIGAPIDQYTVVSINLNVNFSRHIASDLEPVPYKTLEELLVAFASPLADDQAETEEVLRQRNSAKEP